MTKKLRATTVIPVAAPTFAVMVSVPPIGRRPILEYVYANRVPVVGWRVTNSAEPDEIDSTEPVLIGHVASIAATIFIELPEGLYELWAGGYYPDVDAAREWVLKLAQADWDRKHEVREAA
jgi:hypothetical protein